MPYMSFISIKLALNLFSFSEATLNIFHKTYTKVTEWILDSRERMYSLIKFDLKISKLQVKIA